MPLRLTRVFRVEWNDCDQRRPGQADADFVVARLPAGRQPGTACGEHRVGFVGTLHFSGDSAGSIPSTGDHEPPARGAGAGDRFHALGQRTRDLLIGCYVEKLMLQSGFRVAGSSWSKAMRHRFP